MKKEFEPGNVRMIIAAIPERNLKKEEDIDKEAHRLERKHSRKASGEEESHRGEQNEDRHLKRAGSRDGGKAAGRCRGVRDAGDNRTGRKHRACRDCGTEGCTCGTGAGDTGRDW